MSQLGKSSMFLIRLIWKVPMKWATIEEKEGSQYFVEICMLCYMATSNTNTHTVRGRPTPKNEIRRFPNGLVCELKVNERKSLRK